MLLEPVRLGLGGVDAGLRVGRGLLRGLELELRAVVLLRQRADPVAVLVDLVLQRLGLGLRVGDGRRLRGAGRERDDDADRAHERGHERRTDDDPEASAPGVARVVWHGRDGFQSRWSGEAVGGRRSRRASIRGAPRPGRS